jgi:hypothetical protein
LIVRAVLKAYEWRKQFDGRSERRPYLRHRKRLRTLMIGDDFRRYLSVLIRVFTCRRSSLLIAGARRAYFENGADTAQVRFSVSAGKHCASN